MTVKALYPTSEPSLELDFANTKALDPRITFTRASTGTFVGADGLIKTAGNGVARFDHNPVTGASLGLLVEEARTNYLLNNNNYANASFVPTNLNVTINAGVAPDGTSTAVKLAPTATGAKWSVFPVSHGGASIFYTVSLYVKAAGKNTVRVGLWDVAGDPYPYAALFNLMTITGTNIANANNVQIQRAGNGWFRVSFNQIIYSGNTGFQLIFFDESGNNGTDGLLVWGIQIEAGAFPTSYIPTVASAVTRAADVAGLTGTGLSSWFVPDQGTFFSQFKVQATSGFPEIISIGSDFFGGAYVQRLDDAFTNSNLFRGTLTYPGTADLVSTSRTVVSMQTVAMAGTDKPGDYALCINGGTVATSATSVNNPSFTNTHLRIMRGGGTIARLTYYPTRLPNAQLQALTTT